VKVRGKESGDTPVLVTDLELLALGLHRLFLRKPAKMMVVAVVAVVVVVVVVAVVVIVVVVMAVVVVVGK
jgi:hypothetical protein